MKYCPNCLTTYNDESLQFCLEDGTRLKGYFGESSQDKTQVLGEAETIVRQTPKTSGWGQSQVTQVGTLQPEEVKNSNMSLIIILTMLSMCGLFGGTGGLLLLLKGGNEVPPNNNIVINNTPRLPPPSPTSRKTPEANTNERKKNDNSDTGLNIEKGGGGGGFIGCFKDTQPFDLDGYLEAGGDNTPERCIAACRARGFQYAGLQDGKSCLCGNTYGRYGAADNCNVKCTGDNRQICGGFNANSIYSTEARKACQYFLGSGLYDKWKQMGGEGGKLGCPIINETEAPRSPQGTTGQMTRFSKGDGGYIIWHGSGSFKGTSFEVSGCMYKLYASIGGTASWLGFPVKDGYAATGGARQDFEGGYILWDSQTYNCRAFKFQ